MKFYRHTQIGWVILISLGIGVLATGIFGILLSEWISSMVSVLLLICLLLFASLTVVAGDDSVEIRFGVGLIGKRFLLAEIESCRVVSNRWWHGYGIRKIPSGWLFNVSGLDAVELSVKNGKRYRIGTDEPQTLGESIRSKLSKRVQ